MTYYILALVNDLRNKVSIMLDMIDKHQIHKDLLVDDYAPWIRGKLVNISDTLSNMLEDKDLMNPDLIVNYLETYKGLSEEVQLIESFPLPVILKYSPSEHYFHKLIALLVEQIEYPLLSPVVSTISTDYYWTHISYRLIAVPLCEEHLLLNIPDLFHEIGHLLKDAYSSAMEGNFKKYLTDYISNEKKRIIDENRSDQYLGILDEIKRKWDEDWTNEFIGDMIATYLVGPAYAWTNLRLCTNSLSSDNVFWPSIEKFRETMHPSDEARMRGIYQMLRQFDFGSQIEEIDNKWQQYIQISGYDKPIDYNYFYPNDLLDNLAKNVFTGCQNVGLVSYAEQIEGNEINIVRLLNDAWNEFNNAPLNYPSWERKQIRKLRELLLE